jgi:ATP phosphoribosyltransferase
MKTKLKIAIQKSGRLSDKSLELLKEAGIKITNGNRKLIALSQNYPIEILYLRDDDIPQYVYDGIADIGIVGENEVLEKGKKLQVIDRLGFAKCRLSLAIPKNQEFKETSYFNGKRIATSYPNILKKFAEENKLELDIHEISGSVEIATSIGLADAIFDIVSSGSTLISNGLKEVKTILESEAIIVGKNAIPEEKQAILNDILFRIQSVRLAENNKYILLNTPNNKIEEIIKILPGMKSPTITPLVEEGWSSLHSVINEKDFWEIIQELKAKGAQGILVMEIEKMII